jgi:hypothetical protein
VIGMTSEPVPSAPSDARRAWLTYTALRLGVFAVTVGVLLVLGARGFLLLLAALLISSIASLVVLRRQRVALVAAQLAHRERRAADRAAARARIDQS